MSLHRSTDTIPPGLDDLVTSIRGLALRMNQRVAALENDFTATSSANPDELHQLHNRRACLRAAAEVVSSASTMLSLSDRSSTVAPSDFNDVLPSSLSEPMLRWFSGAEPSIYDESELAAPEPVRCGNVSGTTARVADGCHAPAFAVRFEEDADSDCEMEAEIVQLQLRKGREELQNGHPLQAEKILRNGHSRLKRHQSRLEMKDIEMELSGALLKLYQHQENWEKAKNIATERLMLLSRCSPEDTEDYLQESLNLANILLKLGDSMQARVYTKKCIKGYRQQTPQNWFGLGESLEMMVTISRFERNTEDEESFALMLADLLEGQVSITGSSAAHQEDWRQSHQSFEARQDQVHPSSIDLDWHREREENQSLSNLDLAGLVMFESFYDGQDSDTQANTARSAAHEQHSLPSGNTDGSENERFELSGTSIVQIQMVDSAESTRISHAASPPTEIPAVLERQSIQSEAINPGQFHPSQANVNTNSETSLGLPTWAATGAIEANRDPESPVAVLGGHTRGSPSNSRSQAEFRNHVVLTSSSSFRPPVSNIDILEQENRPVATHSERDVEEDVEVPIVQVEDFDELLNHTASSRTISIASTLSTLRTPTSDADPRRSESSRSATSVGSTLFSDNRSTKSLLQPRITVLVIGEPGCGKTSLIL